MRNLTVASTNQHSFDALSLSAHCCDPDTGYSFVCGPNSKRVNEIEVYKSDPDTGSFKSFATFKLDGGDLSSVPSIIAFDFLAETSSLCLIISSGDIATLAIGQSEDFEVVGSVARGIKSASWSPDETLVVLVTSEGKLLLMTNDFDVLLDAPVQTDKFGEEEPVNVGWGSKSTQFHGSQGKLAAQRASANTALAAKGSSSPDDDHLPRISWRGDGAFFVVSSLDKLDSASGIRRRMLRVYNRLGALQSTSEPVPGLEHTLSWKPSGSLIASTQRFGFPGGGQGVSGRHDVVFFERNGLRHGEFSLREKSHANAQSQWGYRVKQLAWNSDSSILAVWLHKQTTDSVQLWCSSNYHWYLKQEVSPPVTADVSEHRFTSVAWHREQSLTLILTTNVKLIQRSFAWDTCASHTSSPDDQGLVAVTDGNTLLLTHFRTQNVPPPMCSHQLVDEHHFEPPIHSAFSADDDVLASIWGNGDVEIQKIVDTSAPRSPLKPLIISRGQLPLDIPWRQVVAYRLSLGDAYLTIVLGRHPQTRVDTLRVVRHMEGDVQGSGSIDLVGGNGRLVDSQNLPVSWQSRTGEVYEVDVGSSRISTVARFPEFCFWSKRITPGMGGAKVYVGLAQTGSLYVTQEGRSALALASNCNSFIAASEFLIFVTTSSEAKFVPFQKLASIFSQHEDQKGDEASHSLPQWEQRRLERGSRIVTAVPSNMSLLLQMPRGNLETIHPRPLVMEAVRQDVACGHYRAAFLACRKHRIDVASLVDYDQRGFLDNVSSFLDQVSEVDHINLFLSSIGRSSHSPELVRDICDAIRTALANRNLKEYINCILTAHVVKSPPDYESALSVLLQLRDSEPTIVEDAIKYIIFLVDAERLFNTALGMYNFSLVLMIAQHSQKDPREYLPFLRELRSMEHYYQRFRIDDHLKRHSKALENLKLAGPSHHDEALVYIEKHDLHLQALRLWEKNDQSYKSILNIYGDWLFDRRNYAEAATAFILSSQHEKALVALERGYEWRDLFDLAIRTNKADEDIVNLARRVGWGLVSKHRYQEAAVVYQDHAKSIPEAVNALVSGNEFSEARRLVSMHKEYDLIETTIKPALLETTAQLSEDIQEMEEQLEKQTGRIKELWIKKVEEPDAYFMEDSNLHNVDTMTDVSTPFTTFTRYTVAPSQVSGTSRRSNRTKRKQERKAGRKGTVDEEKYLLQSLVKLSARISGLQAEISKLLPHLLTVESLEHEEHGRDLQAHLASLELKAQAAIDQIWAQIDVERREPKEESLLRSRLDVEKPLLEVGRWKVGLLGL